MSRERCRIGKEYMSDKISIFKMATTCGDVVTHLINSQQGVRFDFRWLKCLIFWPFRNQTKCSLRFSYDDYCNNIEILWNIVMILNQTGPENRCFLGITAVNIRYRLVISTWLWHPQHFVLPIFPSSEIPRINAYLERMKPKSSSNKHGISYVVIGLDHIFNVCTAITPLGLS